MSLSAYWDLDYRELYPRPTPKIFIVKFLNELWLKLHVYNFSVLIVWLGRHRTGKSQGAVSFAHIIDSTFEKNIEKRVVYDSKTFIAAMKDLRKKKIKGGAVIFDEAGTGDLGSQRWYEDAAKVINAELQACGYLNPFISFVTPNYNFVNTHARRLSQAVFEVSRKHTQFSWIKPLWVEDTPWSNNTYKHFPLFCEMINDDVASNIYKMDRIKISLPPDHIAVRYEKHSQAYKDKLLDDSEEALMDMEFERKKRKATRRSIEEIVNNIKDDPQAYVTAASLKMGKIILDERLIKHKLKTTFTDAKLAKAMVEKDFSKKKIKKQ